VHQDVADGLGVGAKTRQHRHGQYSGQGRHLKVNVKI
jgi:hypothetical protein